MRTRCIQFSIAGTLAMIAACFTAINAVASTNSMAVQPTEVKKRYIISLEDASSPDDFCARRGFKMRKQSNRLPSGFARNLTNNEAVVLPGLNMVICDMNDHNARTARGEKGVLAVEEDGPATLLDQTNPTGLVRMGIDRFPVAHINGTPKQLDVDVAVLDSGINPHPDLNVYQFWSPLYDSGDNNGHGTAVAGIIGAMDNDLGFVGVSPGVRLWDIKIGDYSEVSWTGLVAGMAYVLQQSNSISVVNLSVGNPNYNAPLSAVRGSIRRLVNAGIVVVAAAGNLTNDLAGPDGVYGTSDDQAPASIPEAMAVSAMDPSLDTLANFSNFSQIVRTNGTDIGEIPSTNYVFSTGGAIDVAAPGVNVVTTSASGGYGIGSGTSFAAPHVAGLVALYIAANGRATNAEGVWRIRQAIINSSLPQSHWHPNGQPFDILTNNAADPDTNPEPLAIASEDWVPKPAITNVAGTPDNFQVTFATVPGYDYTVQSATNLTPPIAWTNLATISGINFVTPFSAKDTNAGSQNFYRLVRDPSP